jgi:hypothetical protein
VHPIVGRLDVGELLPFVVGVPVAVLPSLYVGSRLSGVAFGDLVFGLTILTCFGWVLLDLNVRRDRRLPEGRSLLSRRSERFAEVEDASPEQVRSMTKALLGLTGAVLAGWAVLLGT